MAREPAPTAGTPPGWLPLGPASRVVGVDPDTLRRWADTGRVRAYSTPGGHRRFSRADLDRLVAGRRPVARSLAALGATHDRVTRAYVRAYRDAAPVAPDLLRPETREALRAEGRRLVAVLLAYLDATRSGDRERWADEALSLIGDAGRRLAEAGADAREVVAIYLRARRPLLGELAALGRRRALDPTQLAGLYEQAIGLLDRLLLHIVEVHATVRSTDEGRSSSWT
ncbi:MAG TPA: helix-turn-helix domain-containing protein [Candidatus Sulfomarinibacteraceae bacterium]|nr:helix-turn-helix domain-containing protein [Candidatus Sulfomarinibacteraceae bacterium]